MHLRNGISAFAFAFHLVGPMALFMDQPSDEKCVNNVFSNKKYFVTVFLVISFQFSTNKQYPNTP